MIYTNNHLQCNIRQKGRLLALAAFVLAMMACKKMPGIPEPDEGSLAFCSVSFLHKAYLREANAPIMLDGHEGLYFERRGSLLRPGPEAFPSLLGGSGEMTFFWAPSITVTAGSHRTGFYSGGEHPRMLADTLVDVPQNGFGRLFLSDSLGHYRLTYVSETGHAAAREARLRILHFSPDAGELDVQLNGEPLQISLGYRDYSELLTMPLAENQADTSLLLQFRKDETVLLRRSLTLKPGETGYVVANGYLRDADFIDPETGETIAVGAGFRTDAFRYNN